MMWLVTDVLPWFVTTVVMLVAMWKVSRLEEHVRIARQNEAGFIAQIATLESHRSAQKVRLDMIQNTVGDHGPLFERTQAAIISLDDEYKDTIHALGLWQEGIEQSLSDLNVRVAKNTAAIDVQPDTAAIITAVTAPMLELMRPAPFQPADNRAPNDPAEPDDTSWIDTWDPTDDEFPLDRDPADFTPPPAFGGLPGLGG